MCFLNWYFTPAVFINCSFLTILLTESAHRHLLNLTKEA